jgi:hypothetical protein
MAANRYVEFLPVIAKWIQETLGTSAGMARSVESFHFPQLPHYFSEQLLRTTKAVITDRLPVPPLTALGLPEFAAFETHPMSGITYLDTYFLLPDGALDESLHFHELIHVIQWQVLGPKDFLLLYAAGLAEQDIRTHHWSEWPMTTSAGSTLGSRYTQSRRKFGRRRWR